LFLGRTGFFDPAQKEGTRSTSDILIQPEKGELQSPEKSLITKEFSRSSLEQRILAEWRMILDQIEISPQIVAGQPRGFKLTKLPEKSLLSEIGFQRDDIILDLNGEELKDKAFIISLIDRFKNDDRGQITIERCGRQITFELVLK
jgi:type II secretory pathway component PulC